MFPHGRQYPLGIFAELQAELNYWILGALARKHARTSLTLQTDKEFSSRSTVPYSSEKIYRYIEILRDVRSLQRMSSSYSNNHAQRLKIGAQRKRGRRRRTLLFWVSLTHVLKTYTFFSYSRTHSCFEKSHGCALPLCPITRMQR